MTSHGGVRRFSKMHFNREDNHILSERQEAHFPKYLSYSGLKRKALHNIDSKPHVHKEQMSPVA